MTMRLCPVTGVDIGGVAIGDMLGIPEPCVGRIKKRERQPLIWVSNNHAALTGNERRPNQMDNMAPRPDAAVLVHSKVPGSGFATRVTHQLWWPETWRQEGTFFRDPLGPSQFIQLLSI